MNSNYLCDEEKYEKELTNKIDSSINDTDLSLTQESLENYHLDKINKLTNLTHLNLYDCISLHDKLNFISNLTNLQHLSLPFAQLTDEDLKHISPLINLVSLELTQNQITGIGFSYLKFNKLKNLIMIRTYLNIHGVKSLCQSFPNLEYFDYSNHHSNLSDSKCENCTENNFNNDCLIELSKNLNLLKVLHLTDVAITDYSALTYCNSLEELSLHHSGSPSNYIESADKNSRDKNPYNKYYNQDTSLPILPQIKSLYFCREFSKIIMPNIHLYTSLEELSIYGLASDLMHTNIQKLLNLKKICIRANLQNSDIFLLSSLTELEHLDLRYNCDLDDNILKYIVNLINLKHINLIGTKITKSAIDHYKSYFNRNCNIIL